MADHDVGVRSIRKQPISHALPLGIGSLVKTSQLLAGATSLSRTWGESASSASSPCDPDIGLAPPSVAAKREPSPVLLDVTRLISRSWTGRLSTGIDRVCYAYLHHFADRALAVVQHRGIIRILDHWHSRALFDLLLDDADRFNGRIAAFAPRALMAGHTTVPGATYINVSHTDFDLASHARWIKRQALKPVYLIHDLIPLTHSEHCRPRAVQRHRGRVIGALRHGAGIVVSSRAVADDLAAFTRHQQLNTPPVLVAPLAGANLGTDRGIATRNDGYFLCVGTIESRKNHVLLLKVWQRLRDRLGEKTPRLLIVGQWGRGAEAVSDMLDRDPRLADHVSFIERCTDDELANLMAGACAMLLPSLAEGYGLPMAEALSVGLPVIASDLPCFREVGQGIPCLIDPHDVEVWAERIADFGITCPRYRRQVMRTRHFRLPTWVDHFAQVDRWLPTLPGTAGHHPVSPAHLAAPIRMHEGVL